MAFEDIVEGKFSLTQTSLDAKNAKMVEEAIKERIKPKQVQIEGVFTITTFVENGAAKVRDALTKASDAAGKSDIRYLGAGKYKIIVVAEEYKEAEKKLKAATDTVEKAFKNVATSEVGFERIEVKK
jgi:translation initiation factor 2 subunit 1